MPAAARIPGGAVAAGIPATVRRDLTDRERRWKAEGHRDYLGLTARSAATMERVDALTEPPDGMRLDVEGVKPLYLARMEA